MGGKLTVSQVKSFEKEEEIKWLLVGQVQAEDCQSLDLQRCQERLEML